MFVKLIPYYVGCSILNDSGNMSLKLEREEIYTKFDISYKLFLFLSPALY